MADVFDRLNKIKTVSSKTAAPTRKTTTVPSIAPKKTTVTAPKITVPAPAKVGGFGVTDPVAKGTKLPSPTVSAREMNNLQNAAVVGDYSGKTKDLGKGGLGDRISHTATGLTKSYASGFVAAAGGMTAPGDAKNMLSTQTAEQNLETYRKLRDAAKASGNTKDAEKYTRLMKVTENQIKAITADIKKRNDAMAPTHEKLMDTAQKLSGSAEKDLDYAKEGAGTLGKLAIDVGVAGGQMAMDIGLAAVTGGTSLLPMFVRSFGGSYQEAKNYSFNGQQVSDTDALMYGLGAGLASVATEKMWNVAGPFKKAYGEGTLGKIAEATGIKQKIEKSVFAEVAEKLTTTAAGKFVASTLSEGAEEFVEDYVDSVLSKIYVNEQDLETGKFDVKEALYDGLVGSILGGFGGAVDYTQSLSTGLKVKAAQAATANQKYLKADVGVSAEIAKGLHLAEKDSDAYKLASYMDKQVKKNGKVSTADLGQLYRLNNHALAELTERTTNVIDDVTVQAAMENVQSDLVTNGIASAESLASLQNAVTAAESGAVTEADLIQTMQAAHPTETVVSNVVKGFMQRAGLSAEKAAFRADVFERLANGEKVSDKELGRIEFTNPVTKQLFTEAYGVQFPAGKTSLETLRKLYRSVAQVKSEQAANAAAQAVAAVQATNAEEAAAQAEQETLDAQTTEETVTLETGDTLTRDQFIDLIGQTENGAALSYEQKSALFDLAIEQGGVLAPGAGTEEAITLDNGEKLTRSQFKEYAGNVIYPGESPQVLDALFDKVLEAEQNGGRMPFDESMRPYMNEEESQNDGQKENNGEQTEAEPRGDVPVSGGLRGNPDESTSGSRAGVAGGAERASSESGARGNLESQERAEPRAQKTAGRDGTSGRGEQQRSVKSKESSKGPNAAFAEALRAKNPKTKTVKFGYGVKPVQVLSGRHLTKGMKSVNVKLSRVGVKGIAIMGPVVGTNGMRGDGLSIPKLGVVLYRADSDVTSAEQTGLHEVLHNYIRLGGLQLKTDLWPNFVQGLRLNEKKLDALIKETYEKAYTKEFGPFSEKNKWRYREEFLCDVYSGLNNRLGVSEKTMQRWTSALESRVSKWESEYGAKAAAEAEENKKLAELQDRAEQEDAPDDRAFAASSDGDWAEQVSRLNDTTESELYYPTTSGILIEAGLANNAICASKSHIRTSMLPKSESNIHQHGVSEDIVLSIPELLEKPAMILMSHTTPGDILVVTTEVDEDNLPVVLPIHPNSEAKVDGQKVPVHYLLSVYGRNNFAPSKSPRVKDLNNLLALTVRDRGVVYWSRERTEPLLQHCGLRLPFTLDTKVPSDTILRRIGDRVNTSERMFSAEDDFFDTAPDEAEYDEDFEDLDFEDLDFEDLDFEDLEEDPDFLSELEKDLDESNRAREERNKQADAEGIESIEKAMAMMEASEEESAAKESATRSEELSALNAEYAKAAQQLVAALENAGIHVPLYLKNMTENPDPEYDDLESEFESLVRASKSAEATKELTHLGDLQFQVQNYDNPDGDYEDYFAEEDELENLDDEEINQALTESLQTDREGFTPIDSTAFKSWFNDDSGELTYEDDLPKVLIRGSENSGATKAHGWREARSGAIYLTDNVSIAKAYARGISSMVSKTPMDDILGADRNYEANEVKLSYSHSWTAASEYVEKLFYNPQTEIGARLVPLSKTGRSTTPERAVYWALQQDAASGRHSELARFPNTKDGIERFNHELGDIVRSAALGIRGYEKFYGSAKHTLVVDAHMSAFTGIPNLWLPAEVRDKTGSRTFINDLAQNAFKAGYDCVVVKNTVDANGIGTSSAQTQYIFKDSSQIKSVYNRGTWSEEDDDYLFSAESIDPKVKGFLDEVEKKQGSKAADNLAESFLALSKSQAAARELERRMNEFARRYGAIEKGESPAHDVQIPAKTSPKSPVSKTARTVAEAKATPENRLTDIYSAVVNGELTYVPVKDKNLELQARARIRRNGWANALMDWREEVQQGKVNAKLVATGAALVNNVSNSDANGDTYLSLLVDYAELLRNAGQALQAARILKTLSPEAKLLGVEKTIRKLNDLNSVKSALPEGIKPDKSLLDEYRKAKTDEERDAVLDKILKDVAAQIPSTFGDRFRALRYLNMLGNFKTQIRNIAGNVGFQPARLVKDLVGATIESAASLLGVKVERTKSFTVDPETYKAAAADFETVQELIMNGRKFSDARRYANEIEDKRNIFGNADKILGSKKLAEGWNKSVGQGLEAYRKATNWAMETGDVVFCKFTYADALAKFLKANNTSFDNAPKALLERGRNYAIKQASEATYRDTNAFSKAISKMRYKDPSNWAEKGINLLGEGLLPFRKTPANILVRSVEYSPLGFLTTAAETVYGKKTTGSVDGTKLIEGLSKSITGTMLTALGYYLASMGLLRGKGAGDDDRDKDFDELLGHQDYSIELPNGLSLTLDWLAPECIPLFLGAQVSSAAMENGFSFKDGLTALGAITDPMLQMSMLQGVNDALSNASTYGDDSALVRFAGNALWSFATQGLTNTFVGQLERAAKNERSTTYVDKNGNLPDGLQRLLGKTSAKTPGWDYNQIPYIDAWGRVEKNAKTDLGNVMNQLFNPAYTSHVEVSAMESELKRLYNATGNTSVLPKRPNTYLTVDKQRVDLSAEQYLTLSTTSGQTAYSILSDLTKSESYKQLSDKERSDAVSKAFSFASALGKAEATGWGLSDWLAGEPAPEGAYVPDGWVIDAAIGASQYGIPVATYSLAYAKIKDLKSLKSGDGKSIAGSLSLQKAKAILDLNLPDEQSQKLMEGFDVSTKIRKYNATLIERKLDRMMSN